MLGRETGEGSKKVTLTSSLRCWRFTAVLSVWLNSLNCRWPPEWIVNTFIQQDVNPHKLQILWEHLPEFYFCFSIIRSHHKKESENILQVEKNDSREILSHSENMKSGMNQLEWKWFMVLISQQTAFRKSFKKMWHLTGYTNQEFTHKQLWQWCIVPGLSEEQFQDPYWWIKDTEE